jgi:predicted transcriptional regulator
VTTKADDPIPALKRQLAQLMVERIRGWSQIYAAELLGT